MRISRLAGRFGVFFALPLAALTLVGAQLAAATGKQPVSFTAVVVPGAQPLVNAYFTVTPVGMGPEKSTIARSGDGPATMELPEGRYTLVTAYGDTQRQQEIVVGKAPVSHQINLNAGTINMKLIKHVGGPTLTQGVTWEILTFGRDSKGERRHITDSSESQPRFVLPHGFYLARVRIGTQEVRHTVEVTAGITYNYTVILQ